MKDARGRLSDRGFSFTAGLLPSGTTPRGQVIGVGPAGEKQFILENDMNIYRSFRMRSLYTPSWNGFTRCTAVLSTDFSLNAPIIDIGGAFVSADMVYDPAAGDPAFRLTGVGSLEDIAEYAACAAAWLSHDGAAYSLLLPSLSYSLAGFRVEMAPLLGDAGEVWFEVTNIPAP